MKKKILSLFLVAVMLLSTFAIIPATAAGNTWSDSNYVISTADDMAAFEAAVEGGNNFSGKTVTLAADITLPSDWDGIGARSDKPFKGTFDGQGYTITMSGHSDKGSTSVGALFNMVNGATVKNFRMTGSMTLTCATSFTGAVIGCSTGNVTVQDVHCSVNITGNGRVVYAGGLVGVLHNYENATILFDGCIFDGTMNFKNGASEIGGFLGYTGNMSAGQDKKVTIKNCVYAGTMTFRYNLEAKYNGCFVGFAKSGVSGATVYVEVRDSISVGTMQFLNENAFSDQNNGIVVGDYSGTGTTNIVISNFYYMDIPDASGNGVLGLVLKNGKSYNTDGGVVKLVTASTAAKLTANDFSNTARLAFKAAAGGYAYYPCPTAFADAENWPTKLTIEKEADKFSDNPVINTVEDMLAFEAELEGGNAFAGTEVLLNADIVLPNTWDGIGARSDKPFKGTFNGQGYTITMSGHTSSGINGALFCMVTGGTIKNLTLDGSIRWGFSSFQAGLVNTAAGNVTIENVRVSLNITNKPNTNISFAGGFVGFMDNNVPTNLVIDGCLFDGMMNFGNQVSSTAAFLGYTGHAAGTNYYKNVTIKNSVYAGTMAFNDVNYSESNGCFVGNVYAGSGLPVASVEDCISIGTMTYKTEITNSEVNGVIFGATGDTQCTMTAKNFYYVNIANPEKNGNLALAVSGNSVVNATNVVAMTKAEIAALTAANFSADAKMSFNNKDGVNIYYPCPTGLVPEEGWLPVLKYMNGSANVLGAQIRCTGAGDQYSGIRFVGIFQKDAVTGAATTDANFGLILISKEFYDAAADKTSVAGLLTAGGYDVQATQVDDSIDGYYRVNAVVYEITADHYTDEIVAIAYVDGELVGDTVTRSIYDVATKCVADTNATAAQKTFCQEIIDVVEA